MLSVYARTSYCDLSLKPTQKLGVTLVTLHRVCSIPYVILLHHKSLFCCHLGDFTVEIFFLIHPWCQLQGQLLVPFYRPSYRFFFSTRPVINLDLQGQWSVQIYNKANVVNEGSFLQRQWLWAVHFFKDSDQSISSGPVICPLLGPPLSA